MQSKNQIIKGPLYPDMFNVMTPMTCRGEAVCLGCGCTDREPCIDVRGEPCDWASVNYDAGIGACSNPGCEGWKSIVENFDAISACRKRDCRRCRHSKTWLHIVTPQGELAIRYCEWCYL